ncbi:MAG: GIY-YIG nuclease family protein [Candidatus Marinimicrobia bacterium]|nr:GIY-YIG nuclease family protein [Candidatus Neomarinimicrobiota bacterium]
MAFVYILESAKDGQLYTGSTTDLRRRIKEHNLGRSKSTRYRRPLRLVYYEEHTTLVEARIREKALKSPTLGKHKRDLIARFPSNRLIMFAKSNGRGASS